MSIEASIPAPVWILDEAELQQAASCWKKMPWLCIDTEFIRRSTFYPRPALVQLYDGNHIYLVDPLKITRWGALAEVLGMRSLLKIMHAPQEDMDVLRLLANEVPRPLFDTQLAAAFCNFKSPTGYQTLVNDILGITLDKELTCSDWMKRPLSDTQIAYALSDVYYLPRVYTWLRKMIMQDGQGKKIRWLEEECELLVQQFIQGKPPEFAWLDIKLNQPLHAKQQKILKALCAWREGYIRDNDIPRKRTLNNAQLLCIAKKQPDKLYHLQQMSELSPAIIRKFGKTILALVARAKLEDNPVEYMQVYTKPTSQEHAFIKCMQSACKTACRSLNIHCSLLPGKKYALAVIHHKKCTGTLALPQDIKGWRVPILEKIICSVSNTLCSDQD